MPGVPDVSVVVPSHQRPIRLLSLLNALAEQTLAAERWEVVIVHDSGDETDEIVVAHPLASAGRLRRIKLEPGTGTAARQRNIGWRAATALLIAFTDDDTRPQPDWLENLVAAASRAPGAIVQGRTKPDPYEADVMRLAPRARSIDVDPPVLNAQTCNILYPRAALEAVGGFDESFTGGGEDTDLAARVRKNGAGLVGAPDALVYHAVDEFSLLEAIVFNKRWQSLVLVMKRHPELRSMLHHRVFWKERHLTFLIALAGLAMRRPALALPWARQALPGGGKDPLSYARRIGRLPVVAAIDAAEVAAMIAGSIRYRSFVL
jgi:GT2 family glycosyltransferase